MSEDSAAKPEKPDWKFRVTIDGVTKPISPTSIEGNKANIATDFFYEKGEMPDLWIKEAGGGGATIIPYVLIDGEIYVGAIKQFRRLAGSSVTGAPRGFKGKDLTHDETAKTEFNDEAGTRESLSSRIYRFKGQPVSPNNTFIQANPHKKEGSLFYGLKFEENEVVVRRDSKDPKTRVFVLRPELRERVKEVSEKIKPEGLRFFILIFFRIHPMVLL